MCVHVCASVSMRLCMCMRVSMTVHVCTCVYMCVYDCVCLCVCVGTRVTRQNQISLVSRCRAIRVTLRERAAQPPTGAPHACHTHLCFQEKRRNTCRPPRGRTPNSKNCKRYSGFPGSLPAPSGGHLSIFLGWGQSPPGLGWWVVTLRVPGRPVA